MFKLKSFICEKQETVAWKILSVRLQLKRSLWFKLRIEERFDVARLLSSEVMICLWNNHLYNFNQNTVAHLCSLSAYHFQSKLLAILQSQDSGLNKPKSSKKQKVFCYLKDDCNCEQRWHWIRWSIYWSLVTLEDYCYWIICEKAITIPISVNASTSLYLCWPDIEGPHGFFSFIIIMRFPVLVNTAGVQTSVLPVLNGQNLNWTHSVHLSNKINK